MRFNVTLFSLLIVFSLGASSGDTTILQLKWWHQFQFAGYYAAQQKGFYAQEGLQVVIIPGDPAHAPVKQVLADKADYGITGSDLVLDYAHDAPIVALGAIFQHSPYIILSDNNSNIHCPADLIGKRIMASDDQGWAQLKAMLLQEGIPYNSVTIIPHSWNLDDLSNGKADAQTAYVSVEPALLKQKGIQPAIINSINYGIDFYGDVLFTTKQRVDDRPGEVERFRKASFLGWQYAMQHPEEMADYIMTLPGVKERGMTKEILLIEYEEMDKLILPNVVEIGHMNPGRWQHILDVYKSLKLAPADASINAFIYDPEQAKQSRLSKLLISVCIIIALLLSLFIANIYTQRRKRIVTQLKLKKSEEHLELAVNSGGIGIWDWNIAEDVIFYNNTWKTMLGYEPAEIEDHSKTFFDLLHPVDKVFFKKKLDEHIAGKSDSLREAFRMKTKSGKWKWILSQGKAQSRNSEGIATHVAGIHLDLDELKKKEEELHRITDELMRMNTELQQFAFVTSHNLRAPAANMLSLLRIIDYDQLSEQNKNIHGKLKFSADVLLNTLKDLNDILTAKKETDKPKELIHIAERFESVTSMFSDKVSSLAAVIFMDLKVKTINFPVSIFDSIIINLFSNALKFRDIARVLKVEISTWEDDQYVFMKFTDNGMGIDLKLQGEKVFKLYQRFHERIEGKGMGLYIIKTQLENLGGKITVDSFPGEGAEFTVWFKKDVTQS
ncbi:MAG: ABC transporter substrate-binding protein [Bacteroidia bacterium]